MLLLYKLVRDNEGKCTPITRENQGKRKKQETFWNTGWRSWAPWVVPPGGPTNCTPYAVAFRVLCDTPPLQVHPQQDECR
jgi:hypothetical protein